jgi:hypothetical protein
MMKGSVIRKFNNIKTRSNAKCCVRGLVTTAHQVVIVIKVLDLSTMSIDVSERNETDKKFKLTNDFHVLTLRLDFLPICFQR